MQVTIKTQFGEMNFDMPPERVTDLMQRAFEYAAGQQVQNIAPVAPEQPKVKVPENKAHRRVDSLFGNFRGMAEPEEKPQQQEEQHEPEEYRGFLLIKCKHFGKVKGFCAKTPITEHICECGGKTELHDLKPAFLNCKCGGRYKYKTNITDEKFDYNCLNCGSPVDLELNSRRNTYVTISD